MAIEGQDGVDAIEKANNDPWKPLPNMPFTKLADSEKYIQSLEKKLQKISKNKGNCGPTSKDMISSLEVFHKDQLGDLMKRTSISESNFLAAEQLPASSFLYRRLHPEKQAVNVEETLVLVKEDTITKDQEDSHVNKKDQDGASLELYPIFQQNKDRNNGFE